MRKVDIEPIDVNDLHFDYKNPRLAEFGLNESTREDEILKILWEAMSVKELVLSIAASGFFMHEPLIVTEEVVRKKKSLIVIEGNRRLAAVKTIINHFAPTNSINKIKSEIDLGNVNFRLNVERDLKSLPCIRVKDRKEAWQYIGFKHINGPAKWGSFAKAQYISQIHNEFGVPLSEIAEQIGDTHNTVQKLYQGLMVLEQAEKNRVWERADAKASRLYFSHLYTGLNYEGIKKFLGLKDYSAEEDEPVEKSKTEDLGRLLIWLFGSKKYKIDPEIRSQNPDLRNLDLVLKDEAATRALKNGKPLMVAYEMSRPVEDVFLLSLSDVKLGLQKANSLVAEAFSGSLGPLQTAGTIYKQSRTLYENMLQKHKEQSGKAQEEIISEE